MKTPGWREDHFLESEKWIKPTAGPRSYQYHWDGASPSCQWGILLRKYFSLAGWLLCPCERGSGMWKIPLFYLNRILNFNSESITRIIVWDSRKLKRNQICRRKIPPVLRLVGPGIICLDHHLAPIWRLFTTSPAQTCLLIKHLHFGLRIHLETNLGTSWTNLWQNLISALLSLSNVIGSWVSVWTRK